MGNADSTRYGRERHREFRHSYSASLITIIVELWDEQRVRLALPGRNNGLDAVNLFSEIEAHMLQSFRAEALLLTVPTALGLSGRLSRPVPPWVLYAELVVDFLDCPVALL